MRRRFGYRVGPMPETRARAQLLHAVNNLLAVVQTQVEVARMLGTDAARTQALALIADAAARTASEVRRLRGGTGAGPAGEAAPPDA